MRAVQRMVDQGMSLNGALRTCEVSKQRWYWRKKARVPRTDADLLEIILEIRKRRPFYGTRRVAAELARRLGRPVNRKSVRRAYRLAGWSKPAPSRADAKARWKPIKAARPNQVWQTDITYVWCGQADGWCYCFNILDIFTRQWIAYRFDALATADIAVDSLVEAVATAKPDCSGLTIQCDNGSQYAGKKFRKAASHLGIKLKFIWKRTPQQNGHIESFHGTLKREYIWPHDFSNYQQAEAVIAEAFRDYNRNRLHSALKYVPPDEFTASWEAEHK